MTEKSSAFLRQVRDRYPDLAVRTIRLDTSGQNSDILIVNEEIVFRFPRYPDATRRLADEAAILRAIQPHMPLPVPDPVYQHFDTDTPGTAFIGYPMLPGEPLRREMFDALDQAAKDAIAMQLADFLRALHSAPTDAIIRNLSHLDGREYWRDMYERIRAKLFTHIRPDAQIAVASHFETFLNDPDNFAWAPVPRHGDFGPSNILFAPATQWVTGIIDFGSAALGDAAVDVAAFSGYGPDFLPAFQAVYPVTAAMMQRVTFYHGTFALQEALFGIERGDAAAFARGITRYQ